MNDQASSEHCRHKRFNGNSENDGQSQEIRQFGMIKYCYQMQKEGVRSANKHNASVIVGKVTGRFFPEPETGQYGAVQQP
ncbi:hypothetical protein EWW49_27520 [Pseudomonas syringae]|nr:hypothetical protein EWW49_27520 [Pseudomonas syringae]